MPGNRTALMLVDIQYDFLPPNGSLAVANGADILPTVYDLLDHTHFDAYFASQDYHPVGHVSFASAHPGTKPYTSIQVPKLYSSETVEQMLWPDHCVQGTRGCEIEEGVQKRLERLEKLGKVVEYIKKGTNPSVDSYSAFADNQYMSFTPLVRLVYTHQIDRLVIVGLATDYCVRATAIDSRKFGIGTEVVQSGIRGVFPENESIVLEELKTWGCSIV
ncbi:isochorismatase domain-containing protein 2 [Rhizoctonia solani]|uniref:nicotinamidase n=1 Tax=Rhizoctonia solani TaxID=456999 RepID=A0A8H8NPY5_9AGAM|nr:isochorismatase domain-containing protein 2 [Rhizoctonia solani]QRW16253.1 isochorismatase domain-containing protein 2 [Rhizoctonia solani]